MAKFRSTHDTTLVEEILAAQKEQQDSEKAVSPAFERPIYDAEYQVRPPSDASERYKKLAADFRQGIVPDEWVKIYEQLREVILHGFAGGGTYYEDKVEVSNNFYDKYFYYLNSCYFSPGRFLNGYLTRRLRAEGFKIATIRLSQTPGNSYADSMNANLEAQYKRELADWNERSIRYSNSLASPDSVLGSVSNPGAAPKTPLYYTNSKTVSYFYIACTIGKKHSKSDRKAVKKLKYTCDYMERAEKQTTKRYIIK